MTMQYGERQERRKTPIFVRNGVVKSCRSRDGCSIIRRLALLQRRNIRALLDGFLLELAGLASQSGHSIGSDGLLLLRLGLNQGKRATLQLRSHAVNGVGGEVLNVQGILRTDHLPGTNSVQDTQLIRRHASLERLHLGVVRAQVGDFHFLELLIKGLALVSSRRLEGSEAEVDRLGDLILSQLASDIDSALNDFMMLASFRVGELEDAYQAGTSRKHAQIPPHQSH